MDSNYRAMTFKRSTALQDMNAKGIGATIVSIHSDPEGHVVVLGECQSSRNDDVYTPALTLDSDNHIVTSVCGDCPSMKSEKTMRACKHRDSLIRAYNQYMKERS